LTNNNITGKDMENMLLLYKIVVNKNMIPSDKNTSNITSGIRIGTPAITSRGFTSQEIFILSNWINNIINKRNDNVLSNVIKKDILRLCRKHPIYVNYI